MAIEVLKEAFPFLLIFAYILISCTLRVISSYLQNTIDIHTTVRESKLMRINYAKETEQRLGDSGAFNVEICGDDAEDIDHENPQLNAA